MFFASLVTPQIAPFNFGEEPLNEGDTASVQCIVTKGDSPLNISWYFNGRSLDGSYGIGTTLINKKISSLSIESVQEEHMGDYTCTATNLAGSVSYTSHLTINGTKC